MRKECVTDVLSIFSFMLTSQAAFNDMILSKAMTTKLDFLGILFDFTFFLLFYCLYFIHFSHALSY